MVQRINVIRCTIGYHLHNLKNVRNIHGGVLILVKLQAEACNFTKINTPPWVFFMFFKLCKCYQIVQRTTYMVLALPLLFCEWSVSEKENLDKKTTVKFLH